MSHKTLAELQSALQDFLLDKTSDVNDLTLETPTFTRQERLQIYYDAYRLRLIDGLRHDYPALERSLGDDKFIQLTSEFISLNPSQHPSLRWLGEKLPAFLREHSHWHNTLYLVELAEFEWAQSMAFDAADSNLATLDEVRALQPQQWMSMQLKFHPSLQLLSCFSNAPRLWNSLVNNDTVVEPETTNETQDWLIVREHLQVVYRPLEKPEAWALKAFLKQNNFADVCGNLCKWFAEEQVPMQAAQYLQQWIRGGLVIGIITDENNK